MNRVQSAYLNIQTARRDLEWALRYGFDDQRVDSVRCLSDAVTQIQAAMRKLTTNGGKRDEVERKA